MDLEKKFLIGISASISLYKSPMLIRRLREKKASVQVVMTGHATKLISSQLFAAVSDHPVYCNEFDAEQQTPMDHIHLKNSSDYFIIYPATANVIGQFAAGLAYDLLTTVFIAMHPSRIIICPAMNTDMYTHPLVKRNLKILQEIGCNIFAPITGNLACGEFGEGKLIEPNDVVQKLINL